MGLFRRNIDLKRIDEMIPTSKFDLKMQCLSIARGDVDKAVKLYVFVAGGLDIPDVTAPPPTTMQQVKNIAGSVFGWVKENKDGLLEAYNVVRSLRNGSVVETAAEAVTDLPPLE